MKAMIFAAGLGTRLKPFTLEHPKALVPICGMPMLERVVRRLIAFGIKEIVVNVHHFAQQIVDFLRQNGNFGADISISDESSLLLDTGGGLLAARHLLAGEEPIIVCNADILTDFDLAPMVERHMQSGAMATLLVARRATSRYLLLDGDMRMRGWTNVATGQVKPPALDTAGLERYAFGGYHIVSPSIFKKLEGYAPSGTPFSIMNFYIDACRDCLIGGYAPSKQYFWRDIGKYDALHQAEADFGSLLH